MEFHAHLAFTEIIGLLGGRFLKDPDGGQNKLKVEYVFPCRSTSTGIQVCHRYIYITSSSNG